jgi:cobalt-zinc-cadmium efflux system protein
MNMPHDHSSSGRRAAAHTSRLYGVLALSGAAMIVEIAGGIFTGSLALLADAGHMLTDVAGIVLSLVAIRLAQRPATAAKTFGYYRAEILAAFLNALLLALIAVYVLWEAARRFQQPPEIRGGWMLVLAGVGLVANLLSLLLLHGSSEESLNVKGAYLEVLGDTFGSVGAILAALVIWLTGWKLADPLIGVAIGLLILPRAWHLLKQSADILLESAPHDLDMAAIRTALQGIRGVVEVHDLHAWTITTGMNALSVHVVVDGEKDFSDVLTRAAALLRDDFGLTHSTIQVEPSNFHHHDDDCHR